MKNIICLNKNYSTTRLLTKEKPVIESCENDKFRSVLFLPEGEGRKGEGGLRTKGYFKKSYPDKPLITIITVVFNGEKYLEETIKSVINQTYDNVEYIIIDGGSTDGTLDIIKKYEDKIDYWVSEKDNGMYDALNKGFSISQGDICAWLNADDFYQKWALEYVALIMKKNKYVKWLTGIPVLYNEKGFIVYVSPPKTYFTTFIRMGLYKKGILGWLQQESMFWRRELLEKVGYLNKNLKLAADYDLWIKFSKYENLYTVKTILGGFRVHNNRLNNLNFLKKYFEECESIKKIRLKCFFRFIKPIINFFSIFIPWRKLTILDYKGK